MRWTRRHLRDQLDRLGNEDAPSADSLFVNRLEERLRSTRPAPVYVPSPAARRVRGGVWRPMPVAFAAVAAAVVVFVALALVPSSPPQPVYLEPGSTTTSTELPTTTTLVPDPARPFPTTTVPPGTPTTSTTSFFGPSGTTAPTPPPKPGGPRPAPPTSTTSTTANPQPSTTQKPPPPTSYPPPKQTTTTRPPPPPPSQLGLTCAAGSPEGRPGVDCGWSESSSPGFYGYRLWRKVNDGPPAAVFESKDRTMRRYLDRNVSVGTNYTYLVEALDSSGRVIAASSPVRVTCC